MGVVLQNAFGLASLKKRAILAARPRGRIQRAACRCVAAGFVRGLTLLFLLLAPQPNRARPESAIVPFRTMNTYILVEAKVNGNPATLLLDTGANRTIVSMKIYGAVPVNLQRARQNNGGPGLAGESLRLRADIAFANQMWVGQTVSIMNLEDLKRELGINFDGLLGQDLLREYRSVRIDYKRHVIELEE